MRRASSEVALSCLPTGAMHDGLAAMFDDYTRFGFRGGNNLVLRTLDSYLAELAR